MAIHLNGKSNLPGVYNQGGFFKNPTFLRGEKDPTPFSFDSANK